MNQIPKCDEMKQMNINNWIILLGLISVLLLSIQLFGCIAYLLTSMLKHVLHTGGSREVQALDGRIWCHIIILLVVLVHIHRLHGMCIRCIRKTIVVEKSINICLLLS